VAVGTLQGSEKTGEDKGIRSRAPFGERKAARPWGHSGEVGAGSPSIRIKRGVGERAGFYANAKRVWGDSCGQRQGNKMKINQSVGEKPRQLNLRKGGYLTMSAAVHTGGDTRREGGDLPTHEGRCK